MTNDGLEEDNVNTNQEMFEALKKLQSKMEVLQSENESLRKEVTTARSRTKSAPKKMVKSVTKRLNMDESKEWDQQEAILEKEGRTTTTGKDAE